MKLSCNLVHHLPFLLCWFRGGVLVLTGAKPALEGTPGECRGWREIELQTAFRTEKRGELQAFKEHVPACMHRDRLPLLGFIVAPSLPLLCVCVRPAPLLPNISAVCVCVRQR